LIRVSAAHGLHGRIAIQIGQPEQPVSVSTGERR
jgi:hypothetical protein